MTGKHQQKIFLLHSTRKQSELIKMQNETPFQIALIIALVPFLAVRIYYRIKTRTFSKDSFPKDNRVMLIILLLILILSFIIMVIWLINSDLMRWSSFSLPGWIRWSGSVLSLAASAWLAWVHNVLGKTIVLN